MTVLRWSDRSENQRLAAERKGANAHADCITSRIERHFIRHGEIRPSTSVSARCRVVDRTYSVDCPRRVHRFARLPPFYGLHSLSALHKGEAAHGACTTSRIRRRFIRIAENALSTATSD
jgi:hypothetical protein